MMPRVLLQERTSASPRDRRAAAGATGARLQAEGVPLAVAIRPEVIADFVAAHDLEVDIEGGCGARFRRALVNEEAGAAFYAVERLGYRGFVVGEPTPDFVCAALRARELWRTRKRDFVDDSDGVKHAFERLDAVLALVDR